MYKIYRQKIPAWTVLIPIVLWIIAMVLVGYAIEMLEIKYLELEAVSTRNYKNIEKSFEIHKTTEQAFKSLQKYIETEMKIREHKDDLER